MNILLSDEIKDRINCADLLQMQGIQCGRGNIPCPFPDHEDNDPSFGLCHDNRGFKCFGCDRGGTVIDLAMHLNGMDQKDAIIWLGEKLNIIEPSTPAPVSKPKKKQQLGNVVRTYDYTDADGSMIFQVLRYEPKDFRQRRPDGNGGWSMSVPQEYRTLYRLPEVIASARVYLVEGEKDADTMHDIGLTATTMPIGARGSGKVNWSPKYSEILRGKEVVIIADNDESGHGHAAAVEIELAGIAKRVALFKSAKLADAPPKSDVSDWVNSGLLSAVDIQQDGEASLYPPKFDSMADAVKQFGDYMRRKASGEIKPIKTGLWFIDDRMSIEPGNVVIVAARPAGGKTSTMVSIAALQAKSGLAVPGFFSLEMTTEEMTCRLQSCISGVPFKSIWDNDLDEHQRNQVSTATHSIINSPMRFVAPRKRMGIADIEKVAAEWVDRHGVNIIYLDQLSKIKPSEGKSRFEQFSNNMSSVKELALKLNVPIVMAAQIRRPGDPSKLTPPRLSELKDTGQIEEDADIVLMPWRPDSEGNIPEGSTHDFNGRRVEMCGRIFFFCRKYRNGQTWSHYTDFDGPTMTVHRTRS
jgi:replicative DNA helicase